MHGSIRRRGFSALIIPPLILGFLVTVVANSTAAPAAHTPQLIEGKPSAILRYDPTVSERPELRHSGLVVPDRIVCARRH
jgi:hypothetical protein